jgi:hypothetical protein
MYTAIEIAKQSDKPENIELCGISDLHLANSALKADLESGLITEKNKFSNVFSSPNEKFFYTIISYKAKEFSRYESGIGYYENNYIIRQIPICCGKNFTHRIECTNKLPYNFGDVNVIYASSPSSLSEMLFCDNNIITSKCSHLPISLKINENCFIGRFNGDIQNIPFDHNEFIELIANIISKYTKQLSFKTSKLSAPKLSTNEIQLNHNEGNNVKKNTLVYDESLDVIKFFDGNKWRKLKWEEDESQE